MATKKWTYHITHSYEDVESGLKVSSLTQLYQTGVYMIVNNDAAAQFNFKPSQMVNLERKLIKAQDSEFIKNLIFGRKITVIENEDGLYEDEDKN